MLGKNNWIFYLMHGSFNLLLNYNLETYSAIKATLYNTKRVDTSLPSLWAFRLPSDSLAL